VPNVIKIGVPVLGLALHCVTLSVAYVKLSHKNFQYSWREYLVKLRFRNILLDVLYVFFLCLMDEGVVHV
jgi:hypothetical protein